MSHPDSDDTNIHIAKVHNIYCCKHRNVYNKKADLLFCRCRLQSQYERQRVEGRVQSWHINRTL